MNRESAKILYNQLAQNEHLVIKQIREQGAFHINIDGKHEIIRAENDYIDLMKKLEQAMKVEVCIVCEGIVHTEKPLQKAHDDDAAYDIRSNMSGIIKPGERLMVSTGIKIAVEAGYCCFVQPRSGLAAKHGISVVNSPGLIDSGYRNEIFVILENRGEKEFSFSAGERIAQLLVLELPNTMLKEVDELPDSERGMNGIGSTGTK